MKGSGRVIEVIFALVAALTGCGYESSGIGPGGLSGPTMLFADDFSGVFPSPAWIILPTPGTPLQDERSGNPSPSLALGVNGVSSGVQSAVRPFSTFSGLSVSVDIGFPAFTTGQAARCTFGITDQDLINPFASVMISLPPPSITYSICARSGDCTTVTVPVQFDPGFHTFTFSVDANGTARWHRDGIQQAFATRAFPSDNMIIKIIGKTSGGLFPSPGVPSRVIGIHFDNITVTTP